MIGSAVVLVGVVGGWYVNVDRVTATDGPVQRTVSVERRDLSAAVNATGVIRPKTGAEVRVGSRVSGVLERLDARIGAQVTKGQLLAQLDSALFRAAYDEASASRATAEAEHDFALSQFERARELSATGAITPTDLASFQRALSVAEADVAGAAARLESARIQLEYTRIRAPISGVVASVSTQVGEAVAASFAAPTFLTIIDLERLEVWAYVDETDIGRIEVGQTARFTVDTYAEAEFTGVVSAIRPQAEVQDAVVNYVTVIQIDSGHERTLRPEMTTNTNIILEGRTNVETLPVASVRLDTEGSFVLVAESDGTTVRRSVEIGFRGRQYVEVLDGVGVGDLVVVGSRNVEER
jgi:RND family efflux transporter MFP subunit